MTVTTEIPTVPQPGLYILRAPDGRSCKAWWKYPKRAFYFVGDEVEYTVSFLSGAGWRVEAFIGPSVQSARARGQ